MLAATGKAHVVGAADAVVAVLIRAAVAAVALAAFLGWGALRREHAHAVGATHVLRARVVVAARSDAGFPPAT